MRCREGLSQDAFQGYWREHHGLFMLANMYAFDARKYQKWHIIAGPETELINRSRGGLDDYDGLLWFGEMIWRILLPRRA